MNVDFTQRTDEEGFAVPNGEIYLIACCDCGLVHDFVFVSEDGGPIGVAARRNHDETAERRHPSGPAMMPEGQVRKLVRQYQGRVMGGSATHRAALRLLINDVCAQAFRAGSTKVIINQSAAPVGEDGPPAVKLTRDEAGMCEVSIEIGGQWVLVIRDNGEFISHIVEPQGIRIAIQRDKLSKRFSNRPRTPATADFDLSAPNDAPTQQDKQWNEPSSHFYCWRWPARRSRAHQTTTWTHTAFGCGYT